MSRLGGGRAWVFGDDIDTDVLAPGIYMKGPIEEMARHCLESVEPAFAGTVAEGDVVVGGRNFGLGSSREQAPQCLRLLGVAAVLAPSFGGIFYRNALNLGLPALVCAEAQRIGQGNTVTVDPLAGEVRDETAGLTLACEPLPAHLVAMLADGGLVPHLERRFRGGQQQ